MKTLVILIAASILPQLSFAKNVEPLMGYTYDIDGLAFQVSTGGCTSKDNFLVKQNMSGGYRNLVVYRTAEDPCLGYFPFGTMIYYSYDELNIEPGQKFKIANPLEISQRDIF
jgi:hypothetical protein